MSRLEHVRWIELPSVHDPRGVLTAVEGERDVPFPIRRVFTMHHIVAPRGGHAHRDTEQVVIAAHGSFEATLFDGEREAWFRLDDPTRGLYLPPMLFIAMDAFTPDAVGLVLASTHYEMKRSLRSREAFLAALAEEAP